MKVSYSSDEEEGQISSSPPRGRRPSRSPTKGTRPPSSDKHKRSSDRPGSDHASRSKKQKRDEKSRSPRSRRDTPENMPSRPTSLSPLPSPPRAPMHPDIERDRFGVPGVTGGDAGGSSTPKAGDDANGGPLPPLPGSPDPDDTNGQSRPYSTNDTGRFKGCSRYEDYEPIKKIGEGTFGEVLQYRHKPTSKVYALKRILMHNEKDGIPITALREIKILKSLKHPNIVQLSEIAYQKGDRQSRQRGAIFMVFPYMDHDLAGLLENPLVRFTQAQIKSYVKQLLEGVNFLHQNNILHRDMKGANILIDNAGHLRIADFGLARPFSPDDPNKDYTNCVVTRWYRPPELFLGVTKYTCAIDMWGVGCVLGEILRRRAILAGATDLDQLEKIFKLCGSPTDDSWPRHKELPAFKECISSFTTTHRRSIREMFVGQDPLIVDLIDCLLVLDPKRRYTARQALGHDYFYRGVPAAVPGTSDFTKFPSSHELDARKLKHAAQESFKHIEGAGVNLLEPVPPHFPYDPHEEDRRGYNRDRHREPRHEHSRSSADHRSRDRHRR